jgi:tRNA (guanine37-N1)-methyltransferase
MRTLDRAFFNVSKPISAARVYQNQQISQCRKELTDSHDILDLERLSSITRDPERLNMRCILLKPDVKHDDSSTWSAALQKLVSSETVGLIPYTLHLDYSYWSYSEIVSSILPEDLVHDLPSSFQLIGHVAHFNLRDKYLPYKSLLATVLQDKSPTVKTVINKLESVGMEDRVYRTFAYEVLAGEDDLLVTVKEQACNFTFDYAKVYWNSRLGHEHERLVTEKFQPGEAVCDVMAGVGPFAIPAGKKGVFVWANDLNPESFKYLERGVQSNKVHNWVKCFNEDGSNFIKNAVAGLWREKYNVTTPAPASKEKLPAVTKPQDQNAKRTSKPMMTVHRPRVFSHFVMNLPASAITFLPAFIGVYRHAAIPTGNPMPKVHVYCFAPKSDEVEKINQEICDQISSLLKHPFKLGADDILGEVDVYDVRDISPKKRMFCASFMLPEEVAYRE